MEIVRDAWTDERLDDLNHRIDEGFKETQAEFRTLRLEMRKQEFASVRSEMRTAPCQRAIGDANRICQRQGRDGVSNSFQPADGGGWHAI